MENYVKNLIKKERGGEFLYENFSSLKRGKEIRSQLGNYVHLKFFALHKLSMLYYYPLTKYELYKIGKLHGYSSFPDKEMPKKAEFWNLNKEDIEELQRDYWVTRKFGIPHLIERDNKKKILKYEVEETPAVVYDLNQKCCFFLSGLLSGQIELISGYPCQTVEIKCAGEGHSHCEFEVSLEGKGKPQLPSLDKNNLKLALNNLLNSLSSPNLEKKSKRKELGEFISLSLNQCLNYSLLSISRGHLILSKWAGKKVGDKLIQNTGKNSLTEALDLLKALTLKLRVGILEYELDPERIVIKLKESTLSSGVKNIGINLEAPLEGIIRGALSRATNMKWEVKETKCVALGSDYCEFICRTKNPQELRELLLGG